MYTYSVVLLDFILVRPQSMYAFDRVWFLLEFVVVRYEKMRSAAVLFETEMSITG